jgi:hypothetical protein
MGEQVFMPPAIYPMASVVAAAAPVIAPAPVAAPAVAPIVNNITIAPSAPAPVAAAPAPAPVVAPVVAGGEGHGSVVGGLAMLSSGETSRVGLDWSCTNPYRFAVRVEGQSNGALFDTTADTGQHYPLQCQRID